jgi:hypothetical protein
MRIFPRHLPPGLDVPVPHQRVVAHGVVVRGEARLVVALDRETEARDLRLADAQLVHAVRRARGEAGVGVVREQHGAGIVLVHRVAERGVTWDPNFRLGSPSVSVRVDHAHVVLAGVRAVGEGLGQVHRLQNHD